MVWNVTEAIQALKNDQHTPVAVRNELNRMRDGREDRLSVKTKAYIAAHAIQNNDSHYNNTLWMNQNVSSLNRLLRSKEHCVVVSSLYANLQPAARGALSNRGANIKLYFDLVETLHPANKKTRYTRCEKLIALINEDAYLVGLMLSTHAELRKSFMHLLTDSAFLQFKPLIHFVLSHAELAADLKTQLKFITEHEQAPKEARATLFLREHAAFGLGDGFLPRAIRDNPQYFSDSPEIYTGLLQLNKKQTENILNESKHFGWKLSNALKFLLPNFLRVALNIEPPLKRAELTWLRERHAARTKPVDTSKHMPGSPYHLDKLRAIVIETPPRPGQKASVYANLDESAVRPPHESLSAVEASLQQAADAPLDQSSLRPPHESLSAVEASLQQTADAPLDQSSLRPPHVSLSVVEVSSLQKTYAPLDASSVRPPHESLDEASSVREAHQSLSEVSPVREAHDSLNDVSSVREAHDSLNDVSSVRHAHTSLAINSSLANVSAVRQRNNSLDQVSPVRKANQSLEEVSPPRQAADSDDDLSSFSPLMRELAQPLPVSKRVSTSNISFGSQLTLETALDVAILDASIIDQPPPRVVAEDAYYNNGARISDIVRTKGSHF